MSLGELYEVFNNIEAINEAVNKIGYGNIYINQYTDYISSTQKDEEDVWAINSLSHDAVDVYKGLECYAWPAYNYEQ